MPVFRPGSTVSGVRPKNRSAISSIVRVSGGTTDDRMIPSTVAMSMRLRSNRCVDEDADLVGGALAQRGQAPAFAQLRAVKDAEDDVGVADVDG